MKRAGYERVLELFDVARRQRGNQRIDDPLDQSVDNSSERRADDDGRCEFDDVAAHQKIAKSFEHHVLLKRSTQAAVCQSGVIEMAPSAVNSNRSAMAIRNSSTNQTGLSRASLRNCWLFLQRV